MNEANTVEVIRRDPVPARAGHHVFQVLIALDQLGNALIGGWADETLSSRLWRKRALRGWAKLRKLVDWLAKPIELDHCMRSFRAEIARLQSPPEFRVELIAIEDSAS